MRLASEATTPELQRHFLDQAEVWAGLAERGPEPQDIIQAVDPDASE
jgi:hypothetical protein